jgi:hypothetical protein
VKNQSETRRGCWLGCQAHQLRMSDWLVSEGWVSEGWVISAAVPAMLTTVSDRAIVGMGFGMAFSFQNNGVQNCSGLDSC